MIHHRFDPYFRYVTTFDDSDGSYFRSNVYDEEGNDTGKEPFRGDFPHLLDIGVMGHCQHGLSGACLKAGIFCYQRGGETVHPNMPLELYKDIIAQCQGKTFQVALGGRGDADCHEDFEAILKVTRDHGIVPNITSSGYKMTPEKAAIIKKYCGAAAVSWYKTDYTYSAIEMLLKAGVTTNIHFILSEESIEEAVDLMETNGFPKGIRAVVFLLYKPVGYDRQDLVLKLDNPWLKRFFDLMNADKQDFMMGFDSCLAPGVLNYCPGVAPECIEPCESGRFSAYISSEGWMYPCSFVQDEAYKKDLNVERLQDGWNSEAYERFRSIQLGACPSCDKRDQCLGGCPAMEGITLCSVKEREAVR